MPRTPTTSAYAVLVNTRRDLHKACQGGNQKKMQDALETANAAEEAYKSELASEEAKLQERRQQV